MTHIIFDDKRIELEEGQTVLSALLDHGHDIPNSCRAGVCQSCLMQAVEGNVPPAAQTGLKDTLQAQAFFLACSCEPATPLNIVLPAPDTLRTTATVIEHKLLCQDVLRLRLTTEQDFDYKAGQYVTLWKSDTIGRSYSLASVPALDNYLEFHIRLIPGGMVSPWLHDEIKTGDTLQVQAATGNCFYLPGAPEQKLLLAGTGTGLAPLVGIARDALEQGHSGEIHLCHGARQVNDLYLHDELQHMAGQYSHFHYHASVLENGNLPAHVSTKPLAELVMTVVADPTEWKSFLCGDADIVNALKKKLFLAGVSMNNIYSDPFLNSTEV